MHHEESPDLDRFLDRMRSGKLTPDEMKALEHRLLADPEARRLYRERMTLESALLSEFQATHTDVLPEIMSHSPRPQRPSRWIAAAGIAALLLLAFLVVRNDSSAEKVPAIAHLESASEAAWSHGLFLIGETGVAAGILELKSGMAQLRFKSGALVSLEAPARLELIDPMKCRLLRGTVVVECPDSAKGFIVETEDGHAIDHGTRFAVSVGGTHSGADFEVLDGHISVHHSVSGEVLPLFATQSARLSSQGLHALDSPPSMKKPPAQDQREIRLKTQGRETSIVQSKEDNARELFLDPDLLMVKQDFTPPSGKDADNAKHRRALIGFRLGGIEPRHVSSARLQLNLVPTGLGFASFLPETCTFEIYGIRDDAALESWSATGLLWEDAPGYSGAGHRPEDSEVRLLGSFDIPRGKSTGHIHFESAELTAFVREDSTGELGFLIVRTSPPTNEWSLVHAFASSTHPDAAGPTLELRIGGSP